MPTNKKNTQPFTSLRIVGRKAQKLIERARNSAPSETKKKTVKLPTKEEHDELLVHLSVGSIVQATFAVLFVALGAWAMYHLRDKIILLLLGIFVAAVIDPGVTVLQRHGIPRVLAILLHYLVALLIIFFLLLSFIPIIAVQLQQIAVFISNEADTFLANPQVSLPLLSGDANARLTSITQSMLQSLHINQFSDAIAGMGQSLSDAAQGSLIFAAQLAGSVLNFFISLIVVLVFAFFVQLEKERIVKWTLSFFPEQYRTYMSTKSEAMHSKIGQWARGELLLMLSIASLTFIALIILGMPYALTLAVLAGFCEFIPAVGPLIAAVPAVIIALSQEGFIWALVVSGVYYVIQWCENNLLVPLIMRRAVGLSPIAILFGMMVGISFPETLHPVVGVMLAIPLMTILTIFLEDWRRMHNRD